MSGSWEIGVFPRVQIFIQSQVFDLLRMRCIQLGSFGNKEKAENYWVLSIFTFSNIYLW